jgi:hypothetical protein
VQNFKKWRNPSNIQIHFEFANALFSPRFSCSLAAMDGHINMQIIESERKYLLCLLTIAEELLALLPESVKAKYGVIKGTLALKLGGDAMIPAGSAMHSILSSGIRPQVNASASHQILHGFTHESHAQHDSQVPRPEILRSYAGPANISLVGTEQGCNQAETRNTWRPMLHRMYNSIQSACEQLIVRCPSRLLPPAAWPRNEELELLSLSDHALASACHDALERLLLLHDQDASW